jgi:hypothetical protein
VVATVPLAAYRGLPVDSLRGKVVIDTMNYYPIRDGQMLSSLVSVARRRHWQFLRIGGENSPIQRLLQ